MKKTKIALVIMFAAFFIFSGSSVKSQTIHICDSFPVDGVPKGENTKFSYDVYTDNFVYILVKFPQAYGCNQIAFRREKKGEPGPEMFEDIDPSYTWFCYEMHMPQAGDYTLSVKDCNGVLIGKTNVTMVNK